MSPPIRDLRILYVDDETEAREAFEAAAVELGFCVDTAGGGGEALTRAGKRKYAVIAADLRMPSLSGLSLIQLLRPKSPETSYLIFTGAANLDLPPQSNGEPLVDEIVPKPWSLDELSRILSRAIERYRARTCVAVETVEGGVLVVPSSSDDSSLRALVSEALPGIEIVQCGREGAAETVKRRRLRAAIVEQLDADTELVGRLRRENEDLPLVVVGSMDEEEALGAFTRAGAQDYVSRSRLDPYLLRRSVRHATEHHRAERRVHFLTNHDPVTGLANRELFRERVEHAIRDVKRRRTELALLILDLDRFKTVNDSLGHEIGDKLIAVVAERLRANVGGEATLARLGGDEFGVLLANIESESEAVATAQRILEALVPPARLNEYEIVVTGSIGVALYPEHGESASELLQKADKAMYRAKRNGRDGYEVHTSEDDESHSGVLERLRFESGLRHALERKEYVVFYQPQMPLDRSRLVAVEALLRWQHPRAGIIAPNQFIPFLESTGLIKGVGAWVLETACRQVRLWHDRGFSDLRLSVNLSARQFEGTDLVETVKHVLADSGLPPRLLELEITESLLMRDVERTRRTLDDLKSLGVRLAIDDFGTGHSSLARLTQFPLDCLKIDRSFVRDIETDAHDRAVADAIISLGHSLKLDVVAEGVESEAQLERLAGCDGFQGFLISRPCPAECTAELLSRHAAAGVSEG